MLIIQFYINQRAVYISSVDRVEADSIFGAGLEKQVKNFQRYFNLTDDGKVGPLTWHRMHNFYKSIYNGTTMPGATPPPADAYPGYLLRRGSTGGNVTKIQQWLNGVGQVYTQIPYIAPDGIFGAKTQQAVESFQREFNLTPDGIVGKKTWNRLYNQWQTLVAESMI